MTSVPAGACLRLEACCACKSCLTGVARQAAIRWHAAHSAAGGVDDHGSIPSMEGLDGLSPEQAVIKLQRHTALLQSQLDSMTEREVGRQLPADMHDQTVRSATVPPGHSGEWLSCLAQPDSTGEAEPWRLVVTVHHAGLPGSVGAFSGFLLCRLRG